MLISGVTIQRHKCIKDAVSLFLLWFKYPPQWPKVLGLDLVLINCGD